MIALLLTAVLMHPVHETVSEVEWNDQTGRLEVALRLHSLDEQWLRKQNSRKRTDRVWTTEYVQRNFRVTPLPKKDEPDLAKYTWIGRQQDGAHIWWYFEIESPNKAKPKWIEQRTLFERQDNYTNRVLILNEKPKRSMSLSRKRPRGSLVGESEALSEP